MAVSVADIVLRDLPEPSGPPEPAELADQRVIPLRHPGRWIATIAVLVLAAQFLHGLATNPFYQWGRFGYWFAVQISQVNPPGLPATNS